MQWHWKQVYMVLITRVHWITQETWVIFSRQYIFTTTNHFNSSPSTPRLSIVHLVWSHILSAALRKLPKTQIFPLFKHLQKFQTTKHGCMSQIKGKPQAKFLRKFSRKQRVQFLNTKLIRHSPLTHVHNNELRKWVLWLEHVGDFVPDYSRMEH